MFVNKGWEFLGKIRPLAISFGMILEEKGEFSEKEYEELKNFLKKYKTLIPETPESCEVRTDLQRHNSNIEIGLIFHYAESKWPADKKSQYELIEALRREFEENFYMKFAKKYSHYLNQEYRIIIKDETLRPFLYDKIREIYPNLRIHNDSVIDIKGTPQLKEICLITIANIPENNQKIELLINEAPGDDLTFKINHSTDIMDIIGIY